MFRSTVLAVVALVAAAPSHAQTVDQITKRHIQALGGAEALKAIKSLRITAKMVMGPGMEMPMTVEIKKPGKARVEMTAMGQPIITVLNGKDSWMVNPMMGSSEPTPMPADMISKTEDQASQFEGPLVNYKERGCTLDLVGKEKQEGGDAYKLKLVDKGGQESFYFVDADSYLISRANTRVKAQGQEMNVTVKIGNYKPVAGIMFSHSMDISIEGMPMTQNMTIEKIEVNPVIEDSRFDAPKKAAAPAAAPTPTATSAPAPAAKP